MLLCAHKYTHLDLGIMQRVLPQKFQQKKIIRAKICLFDFGLNVFCNFFFFFKLRI